MSTVSSIKPNIPPKPYYNYAHDLAVYTRLEEAFKAGKSVYENEVKKVQNLPYARELNGLISIQEIFRDNWEDFLKYCKTKNIPIRDSILINVEKAIHCKDLSKGFLYYECPKCGDFEIRGFSCHSRFCASCGKKYREQRAIEISKTCIFTPHRHITWTIAKELRPFFAKHMELYDELFKSVNDVLTYIVQGKSSVAKKRNEQLGFISTLHTFGRSMQYNPHIHTLIAEMTIDKDGNKKRFNYFNYTSLRKSFMFFLLKRIQNHLKEINSNDLKDFYIIKRNLYKNKTSGFYVHAPQIQCKNPKKIKSIVKYISRYAGHPAMSESRILKYDKNTKMIYYYYDPHEDDAIIDEEDKIGRQYVTEHVFEFIGKLIRHIPEENVHTTRYYGFYANHSSIDISSQPKLYKDEQIKVMKSNLTWEQMIINTYKFDPLICKCGCKMELNMEESYFP